MATYVKRLAVIVCWAILVVSAAIGGVAMYLIAAMATFGNQWCGQGTSCVQFWLPQVIALATGVVLIITVLDGRKSAERQQRAYVHTGGVELIDMDGEFHASVDVGNLGETPAHDVIFDAGYLTVRDIRKPFTNEFDLNKTIGTLGPGAHVTAHPTLLRSEYERNMEAIGRKEVRLVLCGTVKYTDVFGTRRQTDFAYTIDHLIVEKTTPMAVAIQGNSAT